MTQQRAVPKPNKSEALTQTDSAPAPVHTLPRATLWESRGASLHLPPPFFFGCLQASQGSLHECRNVISAQTNWNKLGKADLEEEILRSFLGTVESRGPACFPDGAVFLSSKWRDQRVVILHVEKWLLLRGALIDTSLNGSFLASTLSLTGPVLFLCCCFFK